MIVKKLTAVVRTMKCAVGMRTGCARVDVRRCGPAVQPHVWRTMALAAAIGLFPTSHAAQPARAVSSNGVTSQRDPAVEISLPRSAHYVGRDRFVLSDRTLGKFDDCDLYAFVDSDPSKHIHRFYWIQFEAYRPNHPRLHHTYDSPRHATMGGLDFYVDTSISPSIEPPESGSDEAHFYSLLASHGYRRDDFMYVRLVHLTDATKRKELMIIYAESLAEAGYTAAELKKGDSKHSQWASIANGLTRRAERSITITAGETSSR